MSSIADGLARLRSSTVEDGWEGGSPAPQFAHDLICEIYAQPDGAAALGLAVTAVARTVVPIWQEPPDPLLAAIEAIEAWVQGRAPREACRTFASPAEPSSFDCTRAEKSCAAESVAAAARFVAESDPEEALNAMTWAWEAVNQIGGSPELFLVWLSDVALPEALAGRAPAPFAPVFD